MMTKPGASPRKVEWACPKCGATPDKCPEDGTHRTATCIGFICECDGNTSDAHGETANDPCPSATCYHCGWGGTFPPPPFKLAGWAKKAWDAGWRPPEGWTP